MPIIRRRGIRMGIAALCPSYGVMNALAYTACFEVLTGRDRTQAITQTQIQAAKEHLILERVTHLDQLQIAQSNLEAQLHQ